MNPGKRKKDSGIRYLRWPIRLATSHTTKAAKFKQQGKSSEHTTHKQVGLALTVGRSSSREPARKLKLSHLEALRPVTT